MALASLLGRELRGEILRNEPMARHTSLHVGGPAAYFVTPADLDDLQRLAGLLATTGTPWLMVGGGYNLLVRDGGFPGVVISLANLNRIELLSGDRITAEAGATTGRAVRFTEEHRLTGLEFLSGIPGTIGGGIAVNAGAHGETLLDRLATLTTIRNGEMAVTGRESLRYGYRHLGLEPGEIVVAATFQLTTGAPAAIEERIEGFLAHRRTAQRVPFPSAGSFFKNPPGGQAWRLIDAAGLRGYRIGGAQVAEAHANFLVNRGGATARDFLELAGLIKEKVKKESDIDLEEEVRIVGED